MNIFDGFRVQPINPFFSPCYSIKNTIAQELENAGCYIVDTTRVADSLEVLKTNPSTRQILVTKLFEALCTRFGQDFTFKEIFDNSSHQKLWFVDMYNVTKKIRGDPLIKRAVLCNNIIVAGNGSKSSKSIASKMMVGFTNFTKTQREILKYLYDYECLTKFNPLEVVEGLGGFENTTEVYFDEEEFIKYVPDLISVGCYRSRAYNFNPLLLLVIKNCTACTPVLKQLFNELIDKSINSSVKSTMSMMPYQLYTLYLDYINKLPGRKIDTRSTPQIIEDITRQTVVSPPVAENVENKNIGVLMEAIESYRKNKNNLLGLIKWHEDQEELFREMYPFVDIVPDADTVYAMYCVICDVPIETPEEVEMTTEKLDDAYYETDHYYDDEEIYFDIDTPSDEEYDDSPTQLYDIIECTEEDLEEIVLDSDEGSDTPDIISTIDDYLE